MSFTFLYIAALGSATLIIGCGTLALLLAWLPTLRWVPAEARLESLDVTPRAGKYVQMNPHVTAKYSYTCEGIRYEGTRISVFEVRPRLFKGYDPRALRLLDEAMILEEPVHIRLDPKNPRRAILLSPPAWLPVAAGLIAAPILGFITALVIHADTSTASVIAGSSIAGIVFLISLLSRDGAMILMIFSNIS